LSTRTTRAGRWALLAAAICLALPAAAGARSFSLRLPVEFIFFNACVDGEQFSVKGTMHVVGSETGTHAHSKLMGTGVSENGTRYRFTVVSNSHQDIDFSAPGAQQFHFVSKVTINRRGSGPRADDLVQNLATHVTENANGEITASFDRFEVICR
jgi:hypothetical protein